MSYEPSFSDTQHENKIDQDILGPNGHWKDISPTYLAEPVDSNEERCHLCLELPANCRCEESN